MSIPKKNTWTCDTCGELITKIEDGWVEWLWRKTPEGYAGRGLRLVHAGGATRHRGFQCGYNEQFEYSRDKSHLCDNALSMFVGPDGLTKLLMLINDSDVPWQEGVEMIKRLHIPHYEHARHHVQDAIDDDVFELNTTPGFYWNCDLQAVLKYAARKQNPAPSRRHYRLAAAR